MLQSLTIELIKGHLAPLKNRLARLRVNLRDCLREILNEKWKIRFIRAGTTSIAKNLEVADEDVARKIEERPGDKLRYTKKYRDKSWKCRNQRRIR